MIKSSGYNIYVGNNNTGGIVYNSLSHQYLQLPPKKWNVSVKGNALVADSFTHDDIDILCEKGFFVDTEIDEFAIACSRKMSSRLDKRAFHIIVNPTLDCNLRCWYCYESHKKGTRISDDRIESIKKLIAWKYKEDNFKDLSLSFFGGEPMMGASKVLFLIDSAKYFCEQNGINLHVSFTTNGTLLSEKVLEQLNGIPTSLQITIDGSKEQHNKTRGSKLFDSYEVIWKNIKKISQRISNVLFIIRINYDENTFKNADSLIEDILKIEQSKVKISVQKIWQVNSSKINYDQVFNFIKQLSDAGYQTDFLDLSPQISTTCYADKLNSLIINYDGLVYKCTARDFNERNCVGKLEPNGLVSYDYGKLKKYVFADYPDKCKSCSLFPSCYGICSQGVIENNSDCALVAGFSIQDYVWFNYKYRFLKPTNNIGRIE